jgi:hypothetical protein
MTVVDVRVHCKDLLASGSQGRRNEPPHVNNERFVSLGWAAQKHLVGRKRHDARPMDDAAHGLPGRLDSGGLEVLSQEGSQQ